MAFEAYRPKTSAKEGLKPGVRLSKNSLVLNKIARERLNTPEYVELAFDRGSKTIRIKPSEKSEGVALTKTKISAKGFFGHFEINVTGNFGADYSPGENALFVSLI